MSFSRQTQRTMTKRNDDNNQRKIIKKEKIHIVIRVEQNQRQREKNKERAARPAEMIVKEPRVDSYLAPFLWH